MQIKSSKKPVKSDLLVIPVFKTKKLTLTGLTKTHELEAKEAFANKIFEANLGQTLTLHNQKDSKALYKTVTLLGLGEEKEIAISLLKEAGSKISPSSTKSGTVAIQNTKKDQGLWIALAIALANYKFSKYLSKDKDTKISSITVLGTEENTLNIESAIDAITYTRDLVNTTSNEIGPKAMVEEALKLAKLDKKIHVTVLDRKQLKKMGMGLIMAVGQGSQDGPYIVTLEYKNQPKKGQKPVALVGKGLTFDTGGLNLKPTGSLETMKQDKAGACTVLGILKYLIATNAKGHFVITLALAENLIGSNAIRPGDIVKAYNGKTVEITNTDAEGRMVLGDALTYTDKKFNPSHIIDLATLTGAAIVALGNDITALLSTDPKLTKTILDSSEEVNEPVWELPLYENYCKKVKGTVSDLLNYSKGVRAGTIMGGAFLREFVNKKTPLAHLDMGGTAWADEPKPCCPIGATGTNIMLVAKVLEKL